MCNQFAKSAAIFTTCVTLCRGANIPVLPYATVAYSGNSATLLSNSRRPLAGIILTHGKAFGIPLSFEDAPISFSGDYDDITDPSYRSKSSTDRLLVPRGGLLTLTFSTPSAGRAPSDVDQLLAALLSSYKQAGYPGMYAVKKAGSVWHVIPTGARSRYGVVTAVRPLMDTPVVLTAVSAITNKDVLDRIFAQIQTATGRSVFIGTSVGHNYLEEPNIEGFSGTAREALERTFNHFGGHALWLLQCTPVSGPCALNIF